MISFYLTLAMTTPARYVLIPWTLVASIVSLKGPKRFGWFFAISAAILIVGSIALVTWASDPAVDGDGTTVFGAALIAGIFGIYGFLIFLICGVVTVARSHYRSRNSETY